MKEFLNKKIIISLVLSMLISLFGSVDVMAASNRRIGTVEVSECFDYNYTGQFNCIEWEANKNATGYEVYRKVSDDGVWEFLADTVGTNYQDYQIKEILDEIGEDIIVYYKVRPYRETKNSFLLGTFSDSIRYEIVYESYFRDEDELVMNKKQQYYDNMTEILKDFVGAYFLSMRDDLCNNNIDAIEDYDIGYDLYNFYALLYCDLIGDFNADNQFCLMPWKYCPYK
jgi:hypothetical protein